MKKMYFGVALLSALIYAPGAFGALVGPCNCPVNGWICCTSTCCAPTQSECSTRCPAIDLFPNCPSECKFLGWQSYGTGKEISCDSANKKCIYRCTSGYYPANRDISGNFSCVACPSNATCAGNTDLPKCNAGYYRSLVTTAGTYRCDRCPSIIQVPSGSGWGTTVYGKSASGSTSITSCYITSGTGYKDDVGIFTISGNCYYSK